MQIPQLSTIQSAVNGPGSIPKSENPAFREKFDEFVGQTFYGQLLKAMRKSVGKPAYFHGGRTEEIFREELDQILAKRIAESSSAQFTGPMFELMTLSRHEPEI